MVGQLDGRAVSVLIALVACGGDDSGSTVDAGTVGDGITGDSARLMTSVTGVLDGSPFTLRYSAIKRDSSGLIYVCAADYDMITYAECEMSQMPSRTMFLGPFIYDSNGNPKWGPGFQTGLYRVGTNAYTAYLDTGTLTVVEDDPVSGALQLTLSMDFGEAALTTGSIEYP